MVLYTKKMNVEPDDSDGLRICVMRDKRIYNRQLQSFQEKFGRPMYDIHMKSLSPPLELKDGYKNGKISWEEYVPRFKKDVLETQKNLIQLLAIYALNNNVTLLCTENTPEQCHRRLLAEECKKYQPSLEVIVK